MAPSLEPAQPKGGGVVDDFGIFAPIAPPRRGRAVPRALSNPFGMLTGGTSGRSVASSISDVTGSYVSASRLGPSGRDVRGVQHGAAELHGGSSADNVSGEPRRDRSGMPIRDPDGNDMEAQFKMATITFDDDARPTPMVMEVTPAATRLSAVKDFDEAVFWCFRGGGQPDGGASFFPGLSAAQVAQQVFNTVQANVVLRRPEYPFPVHMTDFVVLALCSSALGTNVFEEGTAAEKKAAGTAHVYYFSGRRLMLDDLVLREDMDDGWALAEQQRGQHRWPSGDVPRRRVRVGGADKEKEYKSETVVKKMRAFAQLVRMFYNVQLAEQLETLATGFGALAAYRVSNVRKYPLVLLVSCYEPLMFSYVLGVRLQINNLINHLEHMGKSVRRQHI